MAGLEEKIVARVEAIIRDTVEHEGMELVDVAYHREPYGWVLRVFIDRQGGVTVDDCSFISSQLGDILDVQDVMTHRYRLEVSSPGLNRPLKTEKDFQRFIGETARIATRVAVDNRKNFKGKLVACNGETLVVAVDGIDYRIPLQTLKKAHLEYDFSNEHASLKTRQHKP